MIIYFVWFVIDFDFPTKKSLLNDTKHFAETFIVYTMCDIELNLFLPVYLPLSWRKNQFHKYKRNKENVANTMAHSKWKSFQCVEVMKIYFHRKQIVKHSFVQV